jgi:hypothetical protein
MAASAAARLSAAPVHLHFSNIKPNSSLMNTPTNSLRWAVWISSRIDETSSSRHRVSASRVWRSSVCGDKEGELYLGRQDGPSFCIFFCMARSGCDNRDT